MDRPVSELEDSRRKLLFGIHIDPLRMSDVVAACAQALKTRTLTCIGVVNAAKIVYMQSDEILRDSVLKSNIVLADGQSVVWVSRLLSRPLPERVAGIDLFEELLGLAHREGYSVYLLGARPDVLKKLEENLAARFPGLHIAGSRDGYFKDSEAADVARAIRDSKADMLFLGMSSPKKENFIAAYADTMGVPILHGVGGSFDVLAGVTRRAPLLWQKLGMEWAYRMLQEPRRMAKRYVTTNAGFIVLTLRELWQAMPAFPVTGTGDHPNIGPTPTPQ